MINDVAVVLSKSLRIMLSTFFTERTVLLTVLDILKWGAKKTTNTVDDRSVADFEECLKESGYI